MSHIYDIDQRATPFTPLKPIKESPSAPSIFPASIDQLLKKTIELQCENYRLKCELEELKDRQCSYCKPPDSSDEE